jgi:hypothetical protein
MHICGFMKNLIHCWEKIISYDDSTPGQYKLVLENKTKLSDVFSFLPHGVVNKTETGIGATTLEINAKRNSIIVVPTKVTASTKAFTRNQSLEELSSDDFALPLAMYVGSTTQQFKSVEDKDIRAYHRELGYKKFLVVADSLKRIINTIREDVYKDYFLMIDEVDSFQIDSTFRASMSECFDYFKKFPQESKALVSATMIEFTDPALRALPRTILSYHTPTVHQINVIETNLVREATAQVLADLHNRHPHEKVLIAYNSPLQCANLALHLEREKITGQVEQVILCSSASASKVGIYYAELSGDKLPKPFTYITSAYFSGFDLNDDYHLVCITDGGNDIHTLSTHRLKQIAGRCRQNLLSYTVVYTTKQRFEEEYEKAELLEAAHEELNALKCFENRFNSNNVLRRNVDSLRKLLLSSRKAGLSFTRLNIDGQAEIAYLKIDDKVESTRVLIQECSTVDEFCSVLEAQGHEVTFNQISYTPEVENLAYDKDDQENEYTRVINALKKLSSPDDLYTLLDGRFKWSGTQNTGLNIAKEYRQYVDWDQLITALEDAMQSGAKKRLHNLSVKLFVSTCSPTSELIKELTRYFVVGQEYTPAQAYEKWKSLNSHFQLNLKLENETDSDRLTPLYFRSKRLKDPGRRLIESTKPIDISIKHYRPKNDGWLELLRHSS